MKRAVLALVPALLIVGCSNPADDVAEARVAAETEVKAAIGGDYFAIDPASSSIGFVGSKVTGSHEGGFTEFNGELRIIDGKIADTGNKVVIATPSMFTDTDKLTRHLKSDDFFDVLKHPLSTFETTSIVADTDGSSIVTGNLSMHGVTKSISFPATITVSDSEVTLKAEFHINRFDFEMEYAGQADNLIRKEVVLKFNIIANPGRAEFAAG